MIKLDLHTHSTASKDGGITAKQYQKVLSDGELDVIAITDHGRIDFALEIQAKLGKKIIVGEEIRTTEGEIIGLYLKKPIEEDMSLTETIQAIQAQKGLVYAPHPFETVRNGISNEAFQKHAKDIDIVEGFNGRAAFQNKSKHAIAAAEKYGVAIAASSDAHGYAGLGTHTVVAKKPTKNNLVSQLHESSQNVMRPSVRGVLYPKYHLVRKFSKRKRGE